MVRRRRRVEILVRRANLTPGRKTETSVGRTNTTRTRFQNEETTNPPTEIHRACTNTMAAYAFPIEQRHAEFQLSYSGRSK